ncbi:MAG TPA: glycosyltransferase family 39 protein [Streptosporangiaceae bacterium]|jgi:4-amino-4-deoxy-L-arabinose transferase-like glycosyltransferase|nr:glycosyltransferase family 39 protein [Streptosporangiaceae bacterium]
MTDGAVPDLATEASPATRAAPPDLPQLALRPLLVIAGTLTVLLIAFSDRYGYHRDELYFLQTGQHLAWGYPDQPPFVPLVARLLSDLAAGSLVVLRLPSALMAGTLVLLTGLLTRELGGSRRAQVLAALGIALAPVVIGSEHLLSTTSFDLPAWALLCWLLVRILRTGRERLWLAAGAVAGVGLLDTDLVAFLVFAVVVGLAVAGPRAPLRSAWFYAGGAIALALWAPYLAWQGSHGWPELTVAHSIATGGSGTSAPWWQIIPQQFVLVAVIFAPVWIAGLVGLLRDPRLRPYRALGIAWPVLAVAFMLTGGKPYYLAGMFPVLLAAGAQPTVEELARMRPGLRRALIIATPLLSLGGYVITLPILPMSVVHDTPIVALNYDAGETIGWPTFVGEIAAAYRSLPPAQRAATTVLTSNYGEAGAVDRFGPGDGLPRAYSGHMSFWYWGPPPATATTALVIGYSRSQLGFCGSVRLAVVLNNHEQVSDDEQGEPVWICSQLRESWRALWPSQRLFG